MPDPGEDVERVREALLFSTRNLGRLGSKTPAFRLDRDEELWKVPDEALPALDRIERSLREARRERDEYLRGIGVIITAAGGEVYVPRKLLMDDYIVTRWDRVEDDTIAFSASLAATPSIPPPTPERCGAVVVMPDGEYECCLPAGHEGEHDPNPWHASAVPSAPSIRRAAWPCYESGCGRPHDEEGHHVAQPPEQSRQAWTRQPKAVPPTPERDA